MSQYFGEDVFFNNKVQAFDDINATKVIASAVPGFDGISAGLLASSKNRIYVSTAGDDSNSGLSADDPVRSINKAVEIARTQFDPGDKKSIYVSSGEYTENIPIILPTFCAIIGDSLRTVILRPGVPDVDFFKVREGTMVMNLVFRDNEVDDYTFRYAIAYDTSGEPLVINQSPYALNCSLISTRGRGKNAYSVVAGQWTKGESQTPRGCFAYVDGDAVNSISSGDSTGGNLESMVFALLSIITPGIGIHIDNSAYAQIVNVFGIFNTDNILCENGGYASITNSATNFGINALRSVGFSTIGKTYSQDVGIVTFACASSSGAGSTDRFIIAGAASTISANYSIVSIADDGVGDELVKPGIDKLLRFGYGTGETPFTHPSTEFQIKKVSDKRTIVISSQTRTVYDVAISPRLDQNFSSPYTSYSNFNNVSVRQLRPSVINSSSHTWEYAGSGTDYSALPKNGGFTRTENEQVEESYGQVYTSGTNELGDFKVGNFVILKNNTGEVQFTTPIPIATIDRITFTQGNTNLIITGVENDTTMGGSTPSDNFLPTQRAVNVFVSSGSTTLTNKIIAASSNTITGLTNSNLSGSAGITNANLATPTISGISLGSNLTDLTLGTHLSFASGSTYNGGTARQIVTNATNSNTGSTIVARDSSGNFSTNSITANSFVKSGGTSSQFLKADGSIDSNVYAAANSFNGVLSNILTLNTSGTGISGIATYNNASAVTFTVTSNATSSNTSGAIVARDGSGNFSAGTITASSATINGNLSVSMSNSTGGGIILSDDGDIVDLNDGWASMRFSSGVRVYSANKGGSTAVSLSSGGVVTATDFNSTSDINLKTNIKPILSPLSKLLQLNGVTFNWKKDDRPSVGVIAQEVEKVFPELVNEDENFKTVNYDGLIGLLIEAIKEQQQQIDELKKQVNK